MPSSTSSPCPSLHGSVNNGASTVGDTTPLRAKGNAEPGCLQVLTAIELARQARIAANRAYLAGLRLGPSAMASGEVTAVPAQNALVLAAARQLAEKAALAEARSQVGTSDLPSCRLLV